MQLSLYSLLHHCFTCIFCAALLFLGACARSEDDSSVNERESEPYALVSSFASLETSVDAKLSSRIGKFDSQGHRGARGLRPENSIAGAELAVELGMTTIELDLVVSADQQLVVSHEPNFNPSICQLSGTGLDEETSLYTLDYAQIVGVDCGSRGHIDYPYQQGGPSPKPIFSALVEAADARARQLGRKLPAYNIEIKSDPKWDGDLTPTPDLFARLVVDEIERLGISSRCNVQSFDARPLKEVRRLAPAIRIAYLVGLPARLAAVEKVLGALPDVYSPYHLTLSKGQVERYHAAGVAVIPWTVNDVSRMRTLIGWGVDGIITDYPDRLATLLKP